MWLRAQKTADLFVANCCVLVADVAGRQAMNGRALDYCGRVGGGDGGSGLMWRSARLALSRLSLEPREDRRSCGPLCRFGNCFTVTRGAKGLHGRSAEHGKPIPLTGDKHAANSRDATKPYKSEVEKT